MDSPTAREPDQFNWGSTLWHEFTHIITLQMTDHKIPRWFSEGLSVYEERKGFPGWGDDMKLDYSRGHQGQEASCRSPNSTTDSSVRSIPDQVLVSYYQASMVANTSR